MQKEKKDKPKRLLTFGNFEWIHWIVVCFFLFAGAMTVVFPSLFSGKVIIGTIIVGTVFFIMWVFCVADEIVYLIRIKKWEKPN